jgi:glycosyltransferase involved in cell wall biosynthesis
MIKEEKIRVLVDAHLFDQEFQGTRTFVRELYRALIGKPGLELFFAASDTDNLRREFPGVADENFIRFSSRSSLLRLLIEIPRIIKRYRIDYAHFQYITPLWKNCKYIVTTHDVIFREYPQEFSFFYRVFKTMLYRFGVSRADLCTTVSHYSKRSIEKYLGITADKILITPLGVNPIFFELHDKAAIREAFATRFGFGRFILCVSRFESRKNHALLLRTYLQLKLYKQGYYLVMLGHRSLAVPELDELMDGLHADIRPFVIIRNDITDVELPLFYRAASIFIYLSKAEGFGLPPLEAAATQTPVICSNTTAMQNFNFFGKGHLDPNDQPLFATILAQMLKDPPSVVELSTIADTVYRNYSWQVAADRLYAALLQDETQATIGLVSS